MTKGLCGSAVIRVDRGPIRGAAGKGNVGLSKFLLPLDWKRQSQGQLRHSQLSILTCVEDVHVVDKAYLMSPRCF